MSEGGEPYLHICLREENLTYIYVSGRRTLPTYMSEGGEPYLHICLREENLTYICVCIYVGKVLLPQTYV
jgi:pyruvate/2-oxoacid:ferredoxin oxidoreductase beta subunit